MVECGNPGYWVLGTGGCELLGSNFNVESLDVVSAKAELQSDRNGLKKNAGVVFGKFTFVSLVWSRPRLLAGGGVRDNVAIRVRSRAPSTWVSFRISW